MVQWPGMNSRVFYDSQHAAGVCLGTILTRTHVQLALACQRSMNFGQRKLRLTMQHVYGHSGNLSNACADHAAALGTFGLTSDHNVATRWIRHTFDASACFDGCNNIAEVLERLQRIRTDAASLSQKRCLRCVHHRVHRVYCASHAHTLVLFVFLLSAFFFAVGPLFPRTSDGKSFFICLSTAPSVDDFAHNMWNPLLELLFHEQVSGIFGSFVVEIDLAKIALSCHKAPDLLCYKEGAYDSA